MMVFIGYSLFSKDTKGIQLEKTGICIHVCSSLMMQTLSMTLGCDKSLSRGFPTQSGHPSPSAYLSYIIPSYATVHSALIQFKDNINITFDHRKHGRAQPLQPVATAIRGVDREVDADGK